MFPSTLCTIARTRLVAMALAVILPMVMVGQEQVLASTHDQASIPTLHLGLTGVQWFPTLDPAQAVDTTSDGAIAMVQASLLKRLPNNKLVPYLAQSYKVSKDHLTYTFYLRKDARFSNGDKVTAADVVYSLRRLLDKSTASPSAGTSEILGAADFHAGKTTALPGVKEINTYTVRIKTSVVDAFFITGFAQQNTGIVLDHKVMQGKNATGTNNYLTTTCSGNVGAGPFMFQCRNKSSDLNSFYPSGQTPTVTFVPNPKFFGKKPNYKIVMMSIKDAQTEYLDFQSGQVDASGIPTANIAGDKGKKGFLHFPTYLVWYVSPAFDAAPFDNVHCRLAVAYGINTAQIDKQVLHGTWTPLHVMQPKPLIGYYNGKDNPQYNAAKAKSELAQCPGGIHDQKMVYQNSSSDFDNVFGGAIPAQLAALGIDVKGDGVPAANWVKIATSSQKTNGNPIIMSGLTQSNPNGWCLLRKTGYVLNSADFSNSQYDALCDKALHTFNLAKRAKIYRQAQHIAMAAGVYIPIGQVQAYAIVKAYVKGIVGDPLWGNLAPKDYDWSNIAVSKH